MVASHNAGIRACNILGPTNALQILFKQKLSSYRMRWIVGIVEMAYSQTRLLGNPSHASISGIGGVSDWLALENRGRLTKVVDTSEEHRGFPC